APRSRERPPPARPPCPGSRADTHNDDRRRSYTPTEPDAPAPPMWCPPPSPRPDAPTTHRNPTTRQTGSPRKTTPEWPTDTGDDGHRPDPGSADNRVRPHARPRAEPVGRAPRPPH